MSAGADFDAAAGCYTLYSDFGGSYGAVVGFGCSNYVVAVDFGVELADYCYFGVNFDSYCYYFEVADSESCTVSKKKEEELAVGMSYCCSFGKTKKKLSYYCKNCWYFVVAVVVLSC